MEELVKFIVEKLVDDTNGVTIESEEQDGVFKQFDIRHKVRH